MEIILEKMQTRKGPRKFSLIPMLSFIKRQDNLFRRQRERHQDGHGPEKQGVVEGERLGMSSQGRRHNAKIILDIDGFSSWQKRLLTERCTEKERSAILK